MLVMHVAVERLRQLGDRQARGIDRIDIEAGDSAYG